MIYSWILAIRAARSMFNNGFIAMSNTHVACMNFVNALEKIPGIIAQYEERIAKLKADVPHFEAIISKPWGKEDELRQLKSDLADIDRNTADLVPTHEVPDDRIGVNHDEKDNEENKQDADRQKIKVNNNKALDSSSKEYIVAEPFPIVSGRAHNRDTRMSRGIQ